MRIILIDDDPIFRSGLRLWLNRLPDVQVLSEVDTSAAVLPTLVDWLAPPASPTADSATPPSLSIDLIILSANLGQHQPNVPQPLDLCQQLKTHYPTIPILVLGASSEPVLVAAAQQAGADGYCLKIAPVSVLEGVIRQVAAGQLEWVSAPIAVQSTPQPTQRQADPRPVLLVPGTLALLRRRLRRSGVYQIDQAIEEVTQQLRTLDLSLLDQAVLAGHRRELVAARWLVTRLLATPALAEPSLPSTSPTTPVKSGGLQQQSSTEVPPAPLSTAIAPLSDAFIGNLQSVLFDSVVAKLQTGLVNQTEQPLEIDILNEAKKRELFYLILRKSEEVLSELRYSQVQPDQLLDKRSAILLDLWQVVLIDFFGRYYTVSLNGREVEVATTLLQDAEMVQGQVLNKIPLVAELLSHLLFQTPLMINGHSCVAGNPEALERAETLLEHLMIQIANAVLQPLLNHFANVEAIKQTYYDRRLLSTREIERFRNDLSWRFRVAQLVSEPKAIFESQHRLLTFQGRGIKAIAIYAPRTHELAQLSGIRRAVTIALEARDAVAPRLRSALSVVGSSVVYVLTEVLGRGIGLIGRGVLKGIGGSWQNGKFSRHDERRD